MTRTIQRAEVKNKDTARPFRRQMSSRMFGFLMALPSILALAALIAYPLGHLVYNSFFRVSRFSPNVAPRFVGLQNYVDVLQDRYVVAACGNTLLFVIASVSLAFIIGLAIALLLYQPLHGRILIRALLLSPLMIAPVVAGLQWRWLFTDQYGVINAILEHLNLPGPLWLADPRFAMISIIIVGTWTSFPFVMLVLVSGLAGVPEEMIEAATVDGAGYWQRLRYILLPLLRPTILVILLIRMMDAFRVFDTIYVLTQGGPGVSTETISTYAYRLAFSNLDFGSAGAMSIMGVLLVTLLSVLLIRLLGEREEMQL